METEQIDQAKFLLNEDRAKDYGDVFVNFRNIKTIANILLKNKGITLEEDDIATIMIALKLARNAFKHKDDNITDLIAYVQIYANLNKEKLSENT